jgi:16S RNA G1207 methylase RsmC
VKKLKKEQTNPSLLAELPEELKANYQTQTYKCSPTIERLKVTAALKLWCDRGYRDIEFGVRRSCGEQRVFVDVLAKNEDCMVGVECASSVHLGWLHWQVAQLRRCLPPNSYLVIVFPLGAGTDSGVKKATSLVDEVWITGKDNNKVEQMMFTAVFHRESTT